MNTFKKLVYTGLLGACLAIAPACNDYLDVSSELTDNLTVQEVFNNPGYTRRWHANIFNCISQYSEMGMGASSGFTGIWNIIAGEVTTAKGPGRDVMVAGYNSENAAFHRWWTLYKYIRQAMIFLDNGKALGSNEDQSQITETEMKRMKAEAKFLIAYSYFSLYELYGPVPIVREVADPEDKGIDYNRATTDEMVAYIDGLLVEVIEGGDLPETIFTGTGSGNDRYNLNEMVRPTKAAALALRAKLWVYAASPLFNGGYPEALKVTNKDGNRLFPDYDAGKWTTAKKRLEEFLAFAEAQGFKLYYAAPGENGTVDPNLSVYELYQYYNDEIIWATSANSYNHVTTNMEPRTTPRDIYNGFGNVGISQESVDAFFMSNGLSIRDAGSGYREDGLTDVVNVCNEKRRTDTQVFTMYAGREPRFYAAVTYQGKSWHKQPTNKPNYTVGFAKGGGADNSKDENPRTGYMLYKFKNRLLLNTGSNVKKWGRPSILLRLADFYLYYAEVCNEIDPSDPNIVRYIDRIRERAGIPGYAELAAAGKKNIAGNQALQREAIRHERQVEFFAEGQRYFDIHRWMICEEGEAADQTIFSGMDMTGKADAPIGEYGSFYRRVTVENRAWRRAMYFYPIPYNEVQKSRLIVQNPLW